MLKRAPAVFGYGRASTSHQELTHDAQKSACDREFSHRTEPGGKWDGYIWGGWFYDAATTSRIDFLKRPHGEAIARIAQPGDVVLTAVMDRMFRKTRDAVVTLEYFLEKGVHLSILNTPYDTTTPEGKLAFCTFANIAEFEREITSRRTREGLKAKGAKNPHSQHYKKRAEPFGWILRGDTKKGNLVPYEEERRMIRYIAHLYYGHGITIDKIARHCDRPEMQTLIKPIKKRRKFASHRTIQEALSAFRLDWPPIPGRLLPTLTQIVDDHVVQQLLPLVHAEKYDPAAIARVCEAPQRVVRPQAAAQYRQRVRASSVGQLANLCGSPSPKQ